MVGAIPAIAQEQIGRIFYMIFMLEPYASVQELGKDSEKLSGFYLGHSYFSVLWQKNDNLTAGSKNRRCGYD
jgi:hypothetical protein